MTGDRSIPRRRFLKLIGAGALAFAAGYPVMVERYLVVVSRFRIPVPRLPRVFSGFRVVHLSDIHYGALVPLGIVRWVVARANRIQRDAIVCTGDYVHGRDTTEQIDRVWPVLAGLAAPEGIYSILGNHDHWADTARSVYWLAASGQDLRHRAAPIVRQGQRIWLVGAGDLWEDHVSLDELLSGVPEDECRIVLAHNPDTADSGFSARVDLMLSGHTHGGQVRLPWAGAPVLPVRNKTYSSGLVTSPRGLRVFISRGIGWAVYPVRLNCLPEIAVLELVPAQAEEDRRG